MLLMDILVNSPLIGSRVRCEEPFWEEINTSELSKGRTESLSLEGQGLCQCWGPGGYRDGS